MSNENLALPSHICHNILKQKTGTSNCNNIPQNDLECLIHFKLVNSNVRVVSIIQCLSRDHCLVISLEQGWGCLSSWALKLRVYWELCSRGTPLTDWVMYTQADVLYILCDLL